jgi:hypothetical protein
LLKSQKELPENTKIKVINDHQRQLLEILSFLRVMNNYYQRKTYFENNFKPLILKNSKNSLSFSQDENNPFFNIPFMLNRLSDDFFNKKDSFKFPDSLILFEAWMHLGIDALYPRIVLHFRFPGLLKREKVRNLFQFIFSTSRGFGFPIYFGPEFYDYKFKYAKIFEPFLKWGYTVCHRVNQAITLGNRILKSKRHHPGEFESVIISEYINNSYKGIDTLLHGYFTNDPKELGTFSSLNEVIDNIIFSYSIGDHAMSIKKDISKKVLSIPLLTNNFISKKYSVDFYYYKKERDKLIRRLKSLDKLKFRLEKSKHFAKKYARMTQKLSHKYPTIDRYYHYKNLLEKIRHLLFITPLYMHTTYNLKNAVKKFKFLKNLIDKLDNNQQYSSDSILLSYIKYYEKRYEFIFTEEEIIKKLEELRAEMAHIWINFKERHFNLALNKLDELSKLNFNDIEYNRKINKYLDDLLPIISIYEIFNRSLSESVYPEIISKSKLFWAYVARFLTSKYNPIGIKLMNLLNRLAYYNWAYLISRKKWNRKQFFNYILKLPIWKYIPIKIKNKILKF